MKRNIFLSLIFVVTLALFVRCNSDNDNTMRWKENDTTDFHIYAGSAGGGVSVPYDTVTKTNIDRDSLRNVILTNHFGTEYNSSLYSLMTIEFSENKITYRDSAALSSSKKTISDYMFRNDSLFVVKSNKDLVFVAMGTTNELYRMKGIAKFKTKEGRDTIVSSNASFDLQKVLTEAEITDFTNATDTISWVNVKYIFR